MRRLRLEHKTRFFFNVLAQKKYSVYFYDLARFRVIPIAEHSPAKENKNNIMP